MDSRLRHKHWVLCHLSLSAPQDTSLHQSTKFRFYFAASFFFNGIQLAFAFGTIRWRGGGVGQWNDIKRANEQICADRVWNHKVLYFQITNQCC